MAEEESQDLPPELDLEEGYEHFTQEQKMNLTCYALKHHSS